MISNKTIIIDDNQSSLKKLTTLMQQKMPQLNLIGTFNCVKDSMQLLHKENPKLVFINLEHLNAEKFLQLQQMQNAKCSIIFITPGTIEENIKYLPTQLMEAKTADKKQLRLKIDDTTHLVKFENIIRLQAQGNYTMFYLNNRTKPVISSRTLKFYRNQLDEKQFIRAHRSHLINRNFIENITNKNGKHVILKDGTAIKVSRRRAKELNSI